MLQANIQQCIDFYINNELFIDNNIITVYDERFNIVNHLVFDEGLISSAEIVNEIKCFSFDKLESHLMPGICGGNK